VLQPRDRRWPYYLATVQVLLRKHVEAVASLREALKLDPHYFPALLQLAKSLLETGEWGKSKKIYDTILQEHPRVAEAYYGEGRAFAAMGRRREAIGYYRAACDLAGSYGTAHYALALALRDLGRSEEADKEFSLYQNNQAGAPELSDPLLE